MCAMVTASASGNVELVNMLSAAITKNSQTKLVPKKTPIKPTSPSKAVNLIQTTRRLLLSANHPQNPGEKMRLIWNRESKMPISTAEKSIDFRYSAQYGTKAPTNM